MILIQKVLQLFGVMRASNASGTKRPASRDRSGGAVRQTHHMREIERLTATDCWKNQQNPNKSSLYDVKQNRQRARKPRRKPCWRMIASSTLSTPGNGGAGRDRTDDILLAKQALSQLSYGPDCVRSTPPEAKNGGPGKT